jgi:heptosyltransferase-2
MKTLIIGPSWVGDMVMSQSLYITLKKQQPDMALHVMAPRWCLPLLARMPQVDHAIEMPLGHGDFKLATRWKLGRELKQSQYAQAIVLPNSLKSALIPFFAGIAKRTGWKGESRYGLLNDLRSNKNAFPLMVQRYIALAFTRQRMHAAKDIPEIPYPTLLVDKEQQQAAIARLNINTEKPILGLCPGAEFGPSKRWPEAHYAAVAERWIANGGEVWVFGSQKDQPVACAIQSYLPAEFQERCHLLAGNTSLTEAIDLLAACTKVVSNDSGLMHITAAVGTPLVAIYGSTSPSYTPPLSQNVQVVQTEIACRPCFKRECPLKHLHCLTNLGPEMILKKLISESKHKSISL